MILSLRIYLVTSICSILYKGLVNYEAVHLVHYGRFDITCSHNFFLHCIWQWRQRMSPKRL